jgi:diacylglycerol kinase
MHFVSHLIARCRHAIRGIIFALRTDRSYRLQVYGLGAIVVGVIFLADELTQTEFFLLLLSWILVLITELQNTAFEAALDHLHPERHDTIGRSKDMAAGAVLTAGVFLFLVIGAVLFT